MAWIAYGWLVLAVLATVLEQIPGASGPPAGAVAGRITSQTSRALLRSALGVAAVTPLTVGAAHATPGDGATRPWTQAEPRSTMQPTGTPWRTAEPPSTIRLSEGGAQPSGTPWRTTEPASSIRLTSPTQLKELRPQPAARQITRPQDRRAPRPQHVVPALPQQPAAQPRPTNTRAGRPAELVDGTRSDAPTDARTQAGTPGEPRTRVGVPGEARTRAGAPGEVGDRVTVPGGERVRVGVPDRPTAGAATRYTDVRSGQPVRVPARVVVKPGDTLWSIAATELGPNATAEDVATRWPAWYAANRQLIGPDPDLILPGQVLRIPAAATGNPVPPTHQEK